MLIQNKRIVVTGGAGFIGSSLCEDVLKHHDKIVSQCSNDVILNNDFAGNIRLSTRKRGPIEFWQRRKLSCMSDYRERVLRFPLQNSQWVAEGAKR